MPYGDPDPSDPTELIGIEVTGDEAAVEEMAYTIAEEFAGLGFDETRILRLFENPSYATAHGALCALGTERIRAIVAECFEFFSGFRLTVQDASEATSAGLIQIGGGRQS